MRSALAVLSMFSLLAPLSPSASAYDTGFIVNQTVRPAHAVPLGVAAQEGPDRDSRDWVIANACSGTVRMCGLGSIAFRGSPGPYEDPSGGDSNVLVEKAASPAGPSWRTFLGGHGDEHGTSIVSNAAGDLVLTGWTRSSDFPALFALHGSGQAGGRDAFILKVSSTGDAILGSESFGGSMDDWGTSVVLDPSEYPIVAGETRADGTVLGMCSDSKPLYCGRFWNGATRNCGLCGCPRDALCSLDGWCVGHARND